MSGHARETSEQRLSGLDQLADLLPTKNEDGQDGFTLLRDLGKLIDDVESRRSCEILAPAEKEQLQMLVASQPDDMQVSNDQVMQLLVGLVKASMASDGDDTRIEDGTQEIDASIKSPPPSSFGASLPRKLKERRKVSNSFRIRSPDSDDTSSTNDEADAELSEAENLMDTSMSGIADASAVDIDVVGRPGKDLAFPNDGAVDHPPSAYQASSSRRKLTTSDPSTPGDGARFGYRGSASGRLPPSSFTRPIPPVAGGTRSRRGSEGSNAMDDNTPGRAMSGRSMRPESASPTVETFGGRTTPLGLGPSRPRPPNRPSSNRRRSSGQSAPSFARATSSQTVVLGSNSPIPSPTVQGGFMSPHGDSAIDETSFDTSFFAKPGDADDASMIAEEHLTEDEEGTEGHPPGRRSKAEERFARGSESTLRLAHDEVEQFQKENAELKRKVQDLKEQLSNATNDTESRLLELSGRNDELSYELAQKKKEEKDAKINANSQALLLARLDADYQTLNKIVEGHKETNNGLTKNNERLMKQRDQLEDTNKRQSQEISDLERQITSLQQDLQQAALDKQGVDTELVRVRKELEAMQRADAELKKQKAINMDLKETISRLNSEIEDMRMQQARGGHSRLPTSQSQGTSSLNGSLRRSLGDELAKTWPEEQEVEEGGKEGIQTVIKTITIHTERVVREAGEVVNETTNETVNGAPTTYINASVSTDFIGVSSSAQTDETMHGTLPPYTADADPNAIERAIEHCHPPLLHLMATQGIDSDADAAYAEVANAVGSRCHILESKLSEKEGKRAKTSRGHARTSSMTAIHPKTGLLAPEHYWIVSAGVVAAVAVGYFLGMSAGGGSDPSTLSLFNERMLMREISSLSNHQNSFIAGTYALRAVGGGAKQVLGRIPI